MKWNKALNVLLGLFIILNVILLIFNYRKSIIAYRLSENRIDTIATLLEKEKVTLQCKLPMVYRPRSSIWLEPLEISNTLRDELVSSLLGNDRSQITITKENVAENSGLVYAKGLEKLKFFKSVVLYENHMPEESVGTLTEKEALKIAKDFTKQISLDKMFDEVKIEYRSESYGAVVTYYEVYRGIPLFDSYVEISIGQQGVVSAKIACANVSERAGKTEPLYPIDQVLFNLVSTLLNEDRPYVIEHIELGYRFSNGEGMHLLAEEAVPMYKIRVKGLSSPLFVNAYTNSIEEMLFISSD